MTVATEQVGVALVKVEDLSDEEGNNVWYVPN
jgi:hypothetical protein